MRRGRRTVLTRLESRAGGLRRAGLHAAIGGFLLVLILAALAPRQGHALTIPSVSTPTVSVPTVTVPKVTVPTVSVPTVTVPTVTAPRSPTPTVPDADGSHGLGPQADAARRSPTVRIPSVPGSSVPAIPSASAGGRAPTGDGLARAASPNGASAACVRIASSASGTGSTGYGTSSTAISGRSVAGIAAATRRPRRASPSHCFRSNACASLCTEPGMPVIARPAGRAGC